MRKQHDLRIRTRLVFGLDNRHCLKLPLQVLWGCWRPCRQFCSPKAGREWSGQFRVSDVSWREENIM